MNLRKYSALLILLLAGGAKAASDVPDQDRLLSDEIIVENGKSKFTPTGKWLFSNRLSLAECRQFLKEHPGMVPYVYKQGNKFTELAEKARKHMESFPSEGARYTWQAIKWGEALDEKTPEDITELSRYKRTFKNGRLSLGCDGDKIFARMPQENRMRFLAQNPDLTGYAQWNELEHRNAALEFEAFALQHNRDNFIASHNAQADLWNESLSRLDQVTDLSDCIKTNEKNQLEFDARGTIIFAHRPLEERTNLLFRIPGLLPFARAQISINNKLLRNLTDDHQKSLGELRTDIQEDLSKLGQKGEAYVKKLKQQKNPPSMQVKHVERVIESWKSAVIEAEDQLRRQESPVQEDEIWVDKGTRKFTDQGLQHFAFQSPATRAKSLRLLNSWPYAMEQARGQSEDAELFADALKDLGFD
jgi:hypothetical protein